jgi:hypothetical protein
MTSDGIMTAAPGTAGLDSSQAGDERHLHLAYGAGFWTAAAHLVRRSLRLG